jgi:hypothetical protein
MESYTNHVVLLELQIVKKKEQTIKTKTHAGFSQTINKIKT